MVIAPILLIAAAWFYLEAYGNPITKILKKWGIFK